jgi:hypothetical protein
MIKNILAYSIKKIQERNPSREILFDCQITLESLEEVPIQGHSFYVTWKFRHPQYQPLLNDGGQTSMEPILKTHRVEWKEPLAFSLRKQISPQYSPTQTPSAPYVTLRVNQKTNTLIDCFIDFKVLYRPTPQARSSRLLGTASINLAVHAGDNRRTLHSYLLKNTNLNVTLKISTLLTQKSGDRLYKCPANKHKTHVDFIDERHDPTEVDVKNRLISPILDTRLGKGSIDTGSSTSSLTDQTGSSQLKTPTSPSDGVIMRHLKYGPYSIDPGNHYSVNNDQIVNNIFMNELADMHNDVANTSNDATEGASLHGPSRTDSFDSYVEADHVSGLIDNIIKRHTTQNDDSASDEEDEHHEHKELDISEVR